MLPGITVDRYKRSGVTFAKSLAGGNDRERDVRGSDDRMIPLSATAHHPALRFHGHTGR
jgi:hypothetical protein